MYTPNIYDRDLFMLEVDQATKDFGGLRALNNVSLRVDEGSFTGLIGPNGSGKTTLFNVISGHLKSTSGRVTFKGQDITGLKPEKICHLGIARTFQIPRPFKSMSVVENVMTALLFGGEYHTHSAQDVRKKALEYINFVELGINELTTPIELTAADLRKLELAKALATKPRLLLVDECLSGLNPEEVSKTSLILKKIHEKMGISVIWVEHVMGALMNLVQRVIVLHYGEVIAEGEPSKVLKDERVITAYFGEVQA